MDIEKKKILIVEDEVPILNGISDKFEHEGFLVIKAKSGQEGLDQAISNHPDIILLDILMPDTDGFYLLENLRKDAWGKEAKVIMWSNSHSATSMQRATDLGVIAFFIKSDMEYRDVVKKVNEFLVK